MQEGEDSPVVPMGSMASGPSSFLGTSSASVFGTLHTSAPPNSLTGFISSKPYLQGPGAPQRPVCSGQGHLLGRCGLPMAAEARSGRRPLAAFS